MRFGSGVMICPKIKNNKRRISLFTFNVKFLLLLICYGVWIGISLEAQTAGEWFEKGLDAFQRQKMEEAVVFFMKAVEIDPYSSDYFFYLAICRHQASQYPDAEAAYTKSLALGGDPDIVLFRRGNLRWVAGNISGALEDYNAVINGNGPTAIAALLNRANLELNEGMYDLVLQDYSQYLRMNPTSSERGNIEKILSLLTDAQNAAKAAEARRLAEEARLREEAAQREALMNDLLESLGGSGEDTKGISAGTDNIHQEFEESSLED